MKVQRNAVFPMPWQLSAKGALSALFRYPIVPIGLVVAGLVNVGSRVIFHRPFPPETTPDGAYARIALAVAERRPRDAFAYLETEAQWASYTVRDLRKEACARIRASYPPDQGKALLEDWRDEAEAEDGADLFSRLAARRGWIRRLQRDLSGPAHVEIAGPRATVVTRGGTRYAFRLRDNGIWGLTLFTADLQAEAEKAARDSKVVERAAADYETVRARPEERHD